LLLQRPLRLIHTGQTCFKHFTAIVPSSFVHDNTIKKQSHFWKKIHIKFLAIFVRLL